MISLREESVSRKELRRIEQTEPQKVGNYWMFISHIKVLDTIEKEMKGRKWKVVEGPSTVLSQNGVDMATSWVVEHYKIHSRIPDAKFSLGVYSSNSGHKRMRMFGGLIIKGIPLIVVDIPRKHTVAIDLERWVQKSLIYCKLRWSHADDYWKMNRTEVPPEEIERIMTLAARKELIPWSRISKVQMLFENRKKQMVWDLYVSFARTIRLSPPLKQMLQLWGFRKLLFESILMKEEEDECLTH